MNFSYCCTVTVKLRSRKKPMMSLICQAEAICTREEINCKTEINVLSLNWHFRISTVFSLQGGGEVGTVCGLGLRVERGG
jgi:hypothetical protein